MVRIQRLLQAALCLEHFARYRSHRQKYLPTVPRPLLQLFADPEEKAPSPSLIDTKAFGDSFENVEDVAAPTTTPSREALGSPPLPPERLASQPLPPRASGGSEKKAEASHEHTSQAGTRVAKVMAALERALAAFRPAELYNISFQVGFADASGSFGVARGVDNVWTGRRLRPTTLIPVGSGTKPFTALQVMQAVERGLLSLDDNATTWADPVLWRLGKTSLKKLFGRLADRVRIRDLLGMTSGFSDYVNMIVNRFSLTQPNVDLDPLFYLKSAARRKMVCVPGTCASYSGANSIILGLVLLQLQGKENWEDLDQIAVVPRALKLSGRYKRLRFAMRGRCVQYAGVAHQIAKYTSKMTKGKQIFQDIIYNSCLNGWTMGNAMTTAETMANFWFDVFQYKFVKRETLRSMMHFKPLKNQWCKGCSYGLGLIRYPAKKTYFSEDKRVALEGHGGTNYGSVARNCGYNAAYKFGVCVTVTSTRGRNCTSIANANAIPNTLCVAYDAILSAVGGPRLRCDTRKPRRKARQTTCDWTKKGHRKDFRVNPRLGKGR